ncbi:DMT family transporter [Streptomyces sp. NPDC096319]|uniref:DMT family transporter n=1 Tax=Streptomyces sp. NPDC096319 TaxID=3366084 RepID=UPI003809FB8C
MSGVVSVLVAAVLWGTVGPAQIWAGSGAHPVSLGAARMLLGGLVLTVVMVRPAGLRTLVRPGLRRWVVASMLVTAAFQVCFLQAVERSGAALSTATTFGTVPVVSGLCGLVLSGERPSRRWGAATLCAVVGIGLLLLPGSEGRADVLGSGFGVASGAAYGVYIAATKELGARGGDLDAAAPVSVLGAGLLVSPSLLLAPEGLFTARGSALVLWLALGTTALGYLLFTRGVGGLSAATVGTLSLTEPLVATVLGVALLGERPGPIAVVGGVLLLGGLVAVSRPTRPRAAAREAREIRKTEEAQEARPEPAGP